MIADERTLDLTQRFPYAARTGFGDSAELSARLIGLIRSGAKTATCGALRDTEAAGEAVPRAGEVMIVEDWDGVPVLAYRLTSVEVMPFYAVPEDFALAEGEGDFAAWREAHRAYFDRNGGFDPAMQIVCERFDLVADTPIRSED